MEKQINQKRKELIGNWFYNIKHSIENEEILFITNRENTLTFENEIHHLLNTYIIPRNYEGTEYNIFNSIDLEKDKTLLSKKNIILIGYNQLSINKISLNKKILCYNFKNGIELNEIKLDNIKLYSKKPVLSTDEKDLIYLNKLVPYELINKSSHMLNYFITNVYGECFYFKETSFKSLIKDTYLDVDNENLWKKDIMITKPINFIFENNLEKHYLYNDIIILKEKGFLTSRLSIVLYRKALFNIDATITEVGRYFNKLLGIKSQTIDLIKISKDSSVNYNVLSKTKVKAYNLNIKAKNEKEIKLETELEIKIHIAKKLLYFTDIEEKTISKIVELPISIIKKYK